MTAQAGSDTRGWLAEQALLVPIGLGLVVLLPVVLRPVLVKGHPWSETYEWLGYLLIGTVYPALGLILASHVFAGARGAVVRSLLAVAALVGGAILLTRDANWGIWLLATGETLLLVVLNRRWHIRAGAPNLPVARLDGWHIGGAVLMSAMLWQVAVRLDFWQPRAVTFWQSKRVWLALLMVTMLLTSVLAAPSERLSWPRTFRGLRVLAIAVAMLIFGWLSFRTADLGTHAAFHHWGVYAGTAEAVRHGGVLLWDTPSQYGFLSILLIANWPATSTWEALYLAEGLLTWLVSGLIFTLLMAAFPGIRGWLAALLLTVTSVFVAPGWAVGVQLPRVYPSIGAFRFFWCYPVVALLVWASSRDLTSRRNFRKVAVAGSIIWVAGVLWSPEMAAFASVIWLPALALMAGARGDRRPMDRVTAAARWLLLPLAILGIAVGIVVVSYLVRYGHGPDLTTYADYIRSPYFTLPMDADGPVWVLLVAQAATLGMLLLLWLSHGINPGAVPLALGNFGALWGVSSYYVGRSHPNNVVNLAPFIIMSLGVVALQSRRYPQISAGTLWLKAAYIPIGAVLATLWLANPRTFDHFRSSLIYRPASHAEEYLLPRADVSLLAAMQDAGVRPDDPLVFISPDRELNPLPAGSVSGQSLLGRATWLPTTAIIPLSAAARSKYFDRFAARTQRGGWLVLPVSVLASAPTEAETWIFDRVINSYSPGKSVVTDTWLVEWFGPRSR